jgi:hypothetical protein
MIKALTDLKSFITVAIICILALVIICDIFGRTLNDNLLLLFTNLATSIFTYYFTKKETTEENTNMENKEEEE